MKTLLKPLQEEQGSVLILCVLMLFLLTVLGISSTTTSDLEMSIATNENFFHMAFYQADGGAEASKEVIEQAIEERIWTDTSPLPLAIDDVDVYNIDFYKNGTLGDDKIPSTSERDLTIPVTVEGRNLNTHVLFGGATELAVGSAIQMAAGYDGLGKSAAGGGAWIDYDIRSKHDGIRNSTSTVQAGWRHVI
jgi:hypothetical protein